MFNHITRSTFLVLFTLGICVSAKGESFVVTKTTDAFDAVCNADCSMRDAIFAANAAPTNDEIRFDPTVFATVQIIHLAGHELTIANQGTLTINGTGPGQLTISGDDQNRVFIIQMGANVMIDGVTIRDGNGLDIGPGGCIASEGNLTLNNSVVSDCFGDQYGGGILNFGKLDLTDCLITNNSTNAYGGGIASIFPGAVLTIINTTLSGNHSDSAGGGLYNSGSATIINSTISDNNSTSVSNGGGGAGIVSSQFKNSNASVTIISSTITRNVARFAGGGISNDGTIINLTNVTINGNSVTEPLRSGGGIASNNTDHPGSVNARNCIIADNIAPNAPDFVGILNSLGYNLIENIQGMTVTGTTTGNIIGQDPKLGPLASNGGPTESCILLAGSPAIDAGGINFPASDQRFFARPVDGDGNGSPAADLGAIEVGASPSIYLVEATGRISIENGRSAFPARVTLTDNAGKVRTTMVNASGYYRFKAVLAGTSYVVRVASKRRIYLPKVVFLTANVSNLDFLF